MPINSSIYVNCLKFIQIASPRFKYMPIEITKIDIFASCGNQFLVLEFQFLVYNMKTWRGDVFKIKISTHLKLKTLTVLIYKHYWILVNIMLYNREQNSSQSKLDCIKNILKLLISKFKIKSRDHGNRTIYSLNINISKWLFVKNFNVNFKMVLN